METQEKNRPTAERERSQIEPSVPQEQTKRQESRHIKLGAREKTDVAKLLGFAGMLAVIALVGLLAFLRPATSETEGRELTRFPDLTWDAVLDGSYFSSITTWYADTFPGRDGLISIRQALEELYGVRPEPRTSPSDETGETAADAENGTDEGSDGTSVEQSLDDQSL